MLIAAAFQLRFRIRHKEVAAKPGGTEIKCSMWGNTNTIKQRNFIDSNKEVCLEGNADKTKYILLSRHQNAGQNHDIKVANGSFENVAQFKYFERQ
jgi:hypothetical protein